MNTPIQILAATFSAKHEAPLVVAHPKHKDLAFVCAESRQIDIVWNWRSSPHIGSLKKMHKHTYKIKLRAIFDQIKCLNKRIHQLLVIAPRMRWRGWSMVFSIFVRDGWFSSDHGFQRKANPRQTFIASKTYGSITKLRNVCVSLPPPSSVMTIFTGIL